MQTTTFTSQIPCVSVKKCGELLSFLYERKIYFDIIFFLTVCFSTQVKVFV